MTLWLSWKQIAIDEMGNDITLKFTTKQQDQVYRKCGISPYFISLSPLSLVKLSLAARSVNSRALPLIKDSSVLTSVLPAKSASRPVDDHFTVVLELTEAQQKLIESVLSQKWSHVLLFPDEFDLNGRYSEKWSDRSPKRVGKSFIIVPDGARYTSGPDDLVIRLPFAETDKSFGKGDHATTRILLCLLEKYFKPGASALDIGTGTGILAVAAIRLGATKVFAVDNDPGAVLAAKRSTVLNKVQRKMKVVTGSFESIKGEFNVVIANLLPPVIIANAKSIAEKTAFGGLLLVSGIVSARVADVIVAIQSVGFRHLESNSMGEWTGVVFEKC